MSPAIPPPATSTSGRSSRTGTGGTSGMSPTSENVPVSANVCTGPRPTTRAGCGPGALASLLGVGPLGSLRGPHAPLAGDRLLAHPTTGFAANALDAVDMAAIEPYVDALERRRVKTRRERCPRADAECAGNGLTTPRSTTAQGSKTFSTPNVKARAYWEREVVALFCQVGRQPNHGEIDHRPPIGGGAACVGRQKKSRSRKHPRDVSVERRVSRYSRYFPLVDCDGILEDAPMIFRIKRDDTSCQPRRCPGDAQRPSFEPRRFCSPRGGFFHIF